jgi:hypothetical protein
MACGSSGPGHRVRPRAARVAMSAGLPHGPPRVRSGGRHPVVGRTLPSGAANRRGHQPGYRHQPGHVPDTVRPEGSHSGKHRTLNPPIAPTGYNFLYGSSRPALRAAGCGGRHRPPEPRAARAFMGREAVSAPNRLAASVSSRNVRHVVALPAFPLVADSSCFGLLPERLGMPIPGLLCPLPSRLSTVTVPSALLDLGRFLVQVRGAVVGCKLTRLGSCRAFLCSRHPVRFVHRRSTHSGVAVQSEAASPT